MKALVLAGGSGTRLRPITHTSAKQLVPVANKPVLFYGLEAIREAGIVDVGIIVGETAAEIETAVGDGSAFGIRVTYIQQEAPLGLAHAVLIARDFLGDDDFVMYLGDNLIIGGISSLVEEFRRNAPDALILLTKVDNPSAFGVAELGAEGRIVRLVEKPQVPPSDLALVGVYMFGTAIHEAVRAIKPSARGELEITEAIQWLVDGDRDVSSHLVEGYWKDTGRLTDMLETNRHLLESVEPAIHGSVDADSSIVGRVVIEEGASLIRSTVRGPAIIGRNTTLIDTYVGPFTSIFHSCAIERTEIEYSIVLERATIRGIGRIEDSLIGRDVEVVPSAALPKAHRLMLGDHSRVSVATVPGA
ncbi:glucose-1-phosphate thymidylyltransferase [Frankia sp. AgB32]|uniref:glucose-1-phosphate thymidylyltransferase n=1 Tax=Frankia sp. AgB32 TaxID=631119 RepID=UPI00200D1717|nr:glucose-1-phosphate thymidylyltransferase [Frankia sp. AgB32]MCK9893834.1 glucose-1-phosphate thymidylyltransferase [Frankia sp. AgB32]